ncbi:MAG: GDSL-type esterase/lipase family protein [Patescibacteria group bacterium]
MIFIKAIIIFLVVYTLASGARFWFYLSRTWALIEVTPAKNYIIEGDSKKLIVTVLGDSASVGTGASDYTKTYHYQVLERHKDTYSFDVENKGIVGARVGDLMSQITEMRDSDLAIISIGGNNVTHATRWSSFERDLQNALDAVSKKTKRIVLLTPGDLGDVLNMPYPVRKFWSRGSSQLGGHVSSVIKDMPNVTYVNMYAVDEGHFQNEPDIYYANDRFHPSDAGYKLWADAIDAKIIFE